MRGSELTRWWLGVGLGALFLVAIGYLALSGRLTLYMHPRYELFTVLMAGIGALLLLIAVLAGRSGGHDHDAGHDHVHDHSHDHAHDHAHRIDRAHGPAPAGADPAAQNSATAPQTGALGARVLLPVAVAAPPPVPPEPRWRVLAGRVWALLLAVLTLGLLLIAPPQSLSPATAEARSVNAGAGAGSDIDAAAIAAGTDYSALTVADWVSLLHQTSDLGYYSGKRADIIGFTSPDPADPENVVYVSRFVVTCCAVDAQAIGVPLYLPGWQRIAPTGTWVRAAGGFAVNPSTGSAQPLVLDTTVLEPVPEPDDPYVF